MIQHVFIDDLYYQEILSLIIFLQHGATKTKVNTNLRYLAFSCTTLHVGVALGGGLGGVLGVAYFDLQ